jgi:predicted dehydrogenase
VLTGMWRRNQATAAQDCQEHGIAHCFTTPEELCASEDVDAVFITSPDAMHHADTLLALKHGKAVLCEKPLSMHASEASEMVAAAEAAGLLFGVAQNFRYNHSLDWIREQIAAGRIGQPQLAHAQFNYPADTAPRKWITDLDLACGGPIGDVGVHCIDSLRYVLGQDVLSVATLAHAIEAGSPVEATASLQIEMTGNVLATVMVSARAPYRSLIEVVGSGGVLIGENALSVDWPVDVVLHRGGKVIETKTFDNSDGYTRMLDSFAAAYRGEAAFLATGPDGLHNMQALDAAYTSWRTGQRERLQP